MKMSARRHIQRQITHTLMSDETVNHPARVPWYWNEVNLFDGAGPQARADFLDNARKLEFRPRQMIFAADDPADRVFLLEQGMVKIYHLSPFGDVIIFWFCMPGDLFGAGGISGSSHQSVYGTAVNRCQVRMLSRPVFEDLLTQHPRVGLNVIKLMGARLRLASDAVSDTVTRRTDARLARALLRIASQCGQRTANGVLVDVAITHQEFANMIGATRQTVNLHLNQFERMGWLHFEHRRLVLNQPEALASIVETHRRAD